MGTGRFLFSFLSACHQAFRMCGIHVFQPRIRHVVSTEHVLILTPCSCPLGLRKWPRRGRVSQPSKRGMQVYLDTFFNSCRVIHAKFWIPMLLKWDIPWQYSSVQLSIEPTLCCPQKQEAHAIFLTDTVVTKITSSSRCGKIEWSSRVCCFVSQTACAKKKKTLLPRLTALAAHG